MADYEDQNSSEYKDMNQETQAADQNPHSAGNVPQAPDPLLQALEDHVLFRPVPDQAWRCQVMFRIIAPQG